MLTVSGSVSSVDKDTFSFTLDARQWTNPDHNGMLPVTARIAEQSKWSDRGRALPHALSIVTFTGPMTSVERDDDEQPLRFHVDIDRHLDFLGMSSISASTPSPGMYPLVFCYITFVNLPGYA